MSDRRPTPDSTGSRPARRIRFQDLMSHRVDHILLVTSLYDAFILAEDGRLNDAVFSQYLALRMSQNPDVTRVFIEALSFSDHFN